MFSSHRHANTKICGFAIGYGKVVCESSFCAPFSTGFLRPRTWTSLGFLRPRAWTSLFPVDSFWTSLRTNANPPGQTEDVSNAKAKRYPHRTRESLKLGTVLLLPKIKRHSFRLKCERLALCRNANDSPGQSLHLGT
jgi:hypothetical protein